MTRLILLSLLLPSLALGAPRPITLINESSLPRSAVLSAVASVAPLLPVATRWEYRSRPRKCRIAQWPLTYTNSFLCYGRERWADRSAGNIVYITSTFSSTGARELVGGVATDCDPSGYAVIYIGRSPKYTGKLAVILAHEVGHLLCAEHDNSLPVTIMHQAAIPFMPNSFSSKSLLEMTRD